MKVSLEILLQKLLWFRGGRSDTVQEAAAEPIPVILPEIDTPDKIKEWAEKFTPLRLENPDHTVTLGAEPNSKVTTDVQIKWMLHSYYDASTLTQVGFETSGNLLSQASAAFVQNRMVGEEFSIIHTVKTQLWCLLKYGTEIWPQSPFKDLNAFAVYRDHPHLHADILLPFDAVIKAMIDSGKLKSKSYGRVHIWLGNFASEQDIEAFLEEIYDEDNDDKPLSAFAESQDTLWYDHDWLERYVFEESEWETSFFYPGSALRCEDVDDIINIVKKETRKGYNVGLSFIEPEKGIDLEQFHPRSFKNENIHLVFAGSYPSSPAFQYL